MLSAPTGCAAVLIDGYTIHALTFLHKRKDEKKGLHTQELTSIWKEIRYLVIDEISMVSAQLNLFGKINIIAWSRTSVLTLKKTVRV
ncbi:hypothetical protein C8J57DRAFT_1382083 [Mycena rebaudengoi]|nr:hypothetical protein C8J57DRAFT_1382083 [Mycena rebaudengoi]